MSMNRFKFPIHAQVLTGMLLGVLFPYIYLSIMGFDGVILYYLRILSDLFLSSMKLVMIPLIFLSLVMSVSDMQDSRSLFRVSLKATFLYLVTTFFAVSIGVLMGKLIRPGHFFLPSIRQALAELGNKSEELRNFPRLLPGNLFQLFGNNAHIIPIVFFSIVFGISMPVKEKYMEQKNPMIRLIALLRDTFAAMMNYFIQFLAPIGTFSIVASSLFHIGEKNPNHIFDFMFALIPYALTVILGLLAMMLGFYPLLLHFFSRITPKKFIRSIFPAQLRAFSTASSTAALPISIEKLRSMGVSKRIAEFVLPIGAVINIDGTALYQGVATLFVAQAFGKHLTLQQELLVVGYVAISSLGLGGIPSASIIGMPILFEYLHIPQEAGLALILPMDRFLDMWRSPTNITSDLCVGLLIAENEGEFIEKKESTEKSVR